MFLPDGTLISASAAPNAGFRRVYYKINTLDKIISYLWHVVYNIADFVCLQPMVKKIKRVRTRAVSVVVVVKELLFLVTSVICVRIRSRRSEVTTTPHHIRSDFCLKGRKLTGILYSLAS